MTGRYNYWPGLKKKKFLDDVRRMKASLTTIADLNCLPPSTGMQWAREAGLTKGRPKYTRVREKGKKSATDQENRHRHALLVVAMKYLLILNMDGANSFRWPVRRSV
ncbi:hypothetical protein LCGC14_3156000 [marine sediment metagenome]|uniref:Uncharacterized protein n=1 Tax=marine sediment metagenome TaxID=412755 RepID=A0A0F8WGU2_9ZZZZ